ncbi:MAG TPA: glycoside hydrolase [Anaerolineae bacterium]|nr:glycoside hydrolase [Anaerolineae bacterium]
MEDSAVTGWQVRRDREERWQPVRVPGCWEDAGFPVDDAGPFWYRCALPLPRFVRGQRLWLRFGAVSYDCAVWIDGQPAGAHRGMWDPFEVEIPPEVVQRRQAEVLVRVEKPASPTAGPDSPPVGGRFPLRQTLSGFLPYVWGHAFGGLWQEVRLRGTGARRLGGVRVQGTAAGEVRAWGECSAPGRAALGIDDPEGRTVLETALDAGPAFEWSGRLAEAQPWSPASPVLYTARLSVAGGEERRIRFGFRTLRAQGAKLLLNRQPLYARMALSWGWYAGSRCPNPGPAQVRDDLLRLRSMGYNGVKLCLWFPPSYYFDLADELGMLLWVELPMWLPQPGPGFYEQAAAEYARLVQEAAQHPSVVLYSLGCELNRDIDAGFLAGLAVQTNALAGDALVCDNSGSGEAYGGWLDGKSHFYDHHFYCDLQYLRPLLDAFAPGWRGSKPWLMGEFCDYDTLRDLPEVVRQAGGSPPWWMRGGERENPQGARWEMRVTGYEEALRRSGLSERWEELVQASLRQALLHRKVTLEAVRARPEVSGYVVTGEADTPVSTAGMWDDLGRSKFEAAEFRAFNDDVVLLVGWDRRRAWVAGGDRPAPGDPYACPAGAAVRAHLLCSSHGALRGRARLAWEVGPPGGVPLAAGGGAVRLRQSRVQEIGLAEFAAPVVERAGRLVLRARLRAGDREYTNEWPLWVYPADPWAGVPRFWLDDPAGVLGDGATQARGSIGVPGEGVRVCTAWTPEVDGWVRGGGRAILLQQKAGAPGPLPVVECPFWREALVWAEPHPAWGGVVEPGSPGLQLWSAATDCALDASTALAKCTPLLRRLDTRGLEVYEYAGVLEWGPGKLLVTTLRLHGGLGEQPAGLSGSPLGSALLAAWVRYLG